MLKISLDDEDQCSDSEKCDNIKKTAIYLCLQG